MHFYLICEGCCVITGSWCEKWGAKCYFVTWKVLSPPNVSSEPLLFCLYLRFGYNSGLLFFIYIYILLCCLFFCFIYSCVCLFLFSFVYFQPLPSIVFFSIASYFFFPQSFSFSHIIWWSLQLWWKYLMFLPVYWYCCLSSLNQVFFNWLWKLLVVLDAPVYVG